LFELCTVLSSYFIVLASIDRYYVSSLNASQRKLSNVKIAQQMIIVIIVVFAMFCLNIPILIDLENNDGMGCSFRPKTIYYQIYLIIEIFIFDMTASCVMIVFGILTIYNTKHMHVRSVYITHGRRTERQLVYMLLIEVSTLIVLNLSMCTMYIMFYL